MSLTREPDGESPSTADYKTQPFRGRWVPVEDCPPSIAMEHLDGVPWWEAPLPRRLHRCTAQTRGWSGLEQIHRCACGATYIRGGWIGKNETRKARSTP